MVAGPPRAPPAGPALQRRVPGVETRVSVDHGASRAFTVVDVRAEDRLGLLHEVAACLSDAGLEIALAKVATEGNRAIDSSLCRPRRREARVASGPGSLEGAPEAVLGGARGRQATPPPSRNPRNEMPPPRVGSLSVRLPEAADASLHNNLSCGRGFECQVGPNRLSTEPRAWGKALRAGEAGPRQETCDVGQGQQGTDERG